MNRINRVRRDPRPMKFLPQPPVEIEPKKTPQSDSLAGCGMIGASMLNNVLITITETCSLPYEFAPHLGNAGLSESHRDTEPQRIVTLFGVAACLDESRRASRAN
jgi:hypothetical protein